MGLKSPLTDLQLDLSRAVDAARALPRESVDESFASLIDIYLGQIAAAILDARHDRNADAPLQR